LAWVDRCDRREEAADLADGGGVTGDDSTTGSVFAGSAFGATVGSDALVAEWMTAGCAVEPDGRRWALSARRPAVRTAPTTKKYFRTGIVAPKAVSPGLIKI
jgi:hypothetical protein